MKVSGIRKGTVMESLLEWLGFIETGTTTFYEDKTIDWRKSWKI